MKDRLQKEFNRLGHEVNDDNWDQPLKEYFKIDSLDKVELAINIEKEFNLNIPDESIEDFVTPQHILDYLNTHGKN